MMENIKELIKDYFGNNHWNSLQGSDGEIFFYKHRNPNIVRPYDFLGRISHIMCNPLPLPVWNRKFK